MGSGSTFAYGVPGRAPSFRVVSGDRTMCAEWDKVLLAGFRQAVLRHVSSNAQCRTIVDETTLLAEMKSSAESLSLRCLTLATATTCLLTRHHHDEKKQRSSRRAAEQSRRRNQKVVRSTLRFLPIKPVCPLAPRTQHMTQELGRK